MAVLTDLPNELLSSIIDDVTPLHIESFALSCKRIYHLCMHQIEGHDVVRSRLAGLREGELLSAVLSDPRIALYPKFLKFESARHWDTSLESVAEIERKPGRISYKMFLEPPVY